MESCAKDAFVSAATKMSDPDEVIWAADSGPVVIASLPSRADELFTRSPLTVTMPLGVRIALPEGEF